MLDSQFKECNKVIMCNTLMHSIIFISGFLNRQTCHKYLAIYFQVFAYEEPQMNTDKRRCLSAADSSAVCESCFPRKNPGKLLAGT